MKVRYDEKADALYINFTPSFAIESEEVKPGIIFDYDKDDRLVGIEILDVKQNVAPGFSILQTEE